ncbi:MAG: CinA family protein [Firmicutes bacterium]|nr:CinA family protein [Bacillota bacterium]
MSRASEVIKRLSGKTLATAESCTGGGIGAALTAVPGSSAVYKGGVISYTNEVKQSVLGVQRDTLERYGAVSEQVAGQMAAGVRMLLDADIAVSVTGLAGPTGDEYGNPVGTVFIGYEDAHATVVRHFCFQGNRDAVRTQTIEAALELILQYNGYTNP